MKTRLLLVRGAVIIMLLAHALIVISLFFLYNSYQAYFYTCWQWWLLRCPGTIGPPDLSSMMHFLEGLTWTPRALVAVALALPPLASVAVLRSPTRMMSLIGMWISLPLTLFYCYVHARAGIEAIVLFPFVDLRGVLPVNWFPVIWFPAVGFALSFLSCLALALYVPLLSARAQGWRAMRRPAHVGVGQHEGAERVSHRDGGELPAYATRRSLWPHPAFIGLLCYLLIGLSLWFQYVVNDYDYYFGNYIGATGWQLLVEGYGYLHDPIGFIWDYHALLAALVLPLVLPVLISLAGLLPFRRKSDHRETLLFQSPYLSYLLNTMGFSLNLFVLAVAQFYPIGGDHWYLRPYMAFVVPSAAFLLSFLYSIVLLDSRLRLRQARE